MIRRRNVSCSWLHSMDPFQSISVTIFSINFDIELYVTHCGAHPFTEYWCLCHELSSAKAYASQLSNYLNTNKDWLTYTHLYKKRTKTRKYLEQQWRQIMQTLMNTSYHTTLYTWNGIVAWLTWISSLIPSTTFWTSSTSEWPRRSALEMSKMPSVLAVSTPPGKKRGRGGGGGRKGAIEGRGRRGEDWGRRTSCREGEEKRRSTGCLPVPLFCSRSFLRISPNLLSVLSLGSLTWTPALRPVPRLEGQVRMNPRCSFHMNSLPAGKAKEEDE